VQQVATLDANRYMSDEKENGLPGPEEITDSEVVRLVLEAAENYSTREAARNAGVSAASIQRFRDGKWERLQWPMRRKLLRYLGRRGLVDLGPSSSGPLPEAAVVKMIRNVAPPGEEKEKKAEVLQAVRVVYSTRGEVPEWWYGLRGKVEEEIL
jgi:hypothetical protein